MAHLDITVTRVNGQYWTSRVNGIAAAASTSPARAAERLAEQLWGTSDLDTVRRLGAPDPAKPHVSRWRITDTAARKQRSAQ